MGIVQGRTFSSLKTKQEQVMSTVRFKTISPSKLGQAYVQMRSNYCEYRKKSFNVLVFHAEDMAELITVRPGLHQKVKRHCSSL